MSGQEIVSADEARNLLRDARRLINRSPDLAASVVALHQITTDLRNELERLRAAVRLCESDGGCRASRIAGSSP